MTYVMSDIHGRYDKYKAMLEKINFSVEDKLYILGDIIDRGPDGFKILLDAASRSNVFTQLGNHEVMAIDALPHALNSIRSIDKEDFAPIDNDAVDLWFDNGGEISLLDFLLLSADKAQAAWEYLLSMPLYREIVVGDRTFVLLHGGLEGFSPERALEDYEVDEIVWCRPKADTVYFPNKYVVLGHTPTQLLYAVNGKPAHPARIFHAETFIDIDCGCVFPRGRLACLCLDTMEEFYI